jgi:hypothetical protein
MNTITRTVNLIRSGNFKSSMRDRINHWVELKLYRVVAWLFKQDAVQRAIVDQISCTTPLGYLLNRHIDNALSDHQKEIDACDGLNREIEDCIERMLDREIEDCIERMLDNFEVDAGNVKNLDTAVMEIVADDKDTQTELVGAVCQEIAERLSK